MASAFVGLGVWGLAKSMKPAVLQPCGHAALRPCRLAALRAGGPAARRPGGPAAMSFGLVAYAVVPCEPMVAYVVKAICFFEVRLCCKVCHET